MSIRRMLFAAIAIFMLHSFATRVPNLYTEHLESGSSSFFSWMGPTPSPSPSPSPSPTPTPDEPPIYAFTHTNHYYTFICDYVMTAAYNGFRFKILGWDPDRPATEFKYGQKFEAAHTAVKEVAAKDPRAIIIFTDAHDVFFTNTVHALYKQFLTLNYSFLFSGEKGCCCEHFEPDGCAERYPKPLHSGPFKFLNSGSWVAYAQTADTLFTEIKTRFPQYATGNDQTYAQEIYVNDELRQKLRIGIDHDTTIFQAMHKTGFTVDQNQGGELVLHEGGRWYNTITKTYPMVFHYNGDAKDRQVPMMEKLPTTALADKDEPVIIDGKQMSIANVTVTGLNMTVRELCCHPVHTDNAKYNKKRPPWLHCV